MNYYIAASITTVVSSLILYWLLRETSWFKGIRKPYLFVLLSLPLSAIVNLYVKGPIYGELIRLFNLPKETPLWPLWFFPIALVVGPLCEEVIKMLPGLRVILKDIKNRNSMYGVGVGGLAGLGFGIGEVWFLAFNFTKGAPEYASGILNLLKLLPGFGGERLLAIVSHSIFTGIVFGGLFVGRPVKYFLLATLLHSFLNLPAMLYKTKMIPLEIASILTSVFVLIVIVIFSKLFGEENRDLLPSQEEVVLYEKNKK